MNRIHRSIWNDSTGTFVAVSEIASSAGKKACAGIASLGAKAGSAGGGAMFVLKALSLGMMAAFGASVQALPQDGAVTAGSASIVSGTDSMTIIQTSPKAAIDWRSFGIGAGEAVRFVQPNASAVALNRVLGADPSQILGSLNANGQVFLVNPGGILFGRSASVNVGGLVASTQGMTNADFMAGRYAFTGTSAAGVVNRGAITAADGGYVALLGARVSNEGVIAARLGTVALAAGQATTLDIAGDGLLNVTVDQGAVNALASNAGLIQADGGQVLMTAQAAGNLLTTAVNNTGVVQARTIDRRGGTIKLLGGMQDGGTVSAAGTLDASAPDGGDGGFIETSAAQVRIDPALKVTTAAAQGATGQWLIDPNDYTIAASGGDITGAQLGGALASSNVTISTATQGTAGGNGDIHVNDAVAWSANKLTLSAERNININSALNGSGTASLALEYGQGAAGVGDYSVRAPVSLPAGNNFSTKLGSSGPTLDYTVITSLGQQGSTSGADLQGINGNLSGRYALGADIDATITGYWNGSTGFAPLGDETTHFTGTFDGLGHSIGNLTIYQPTMNYVGLFSYAETGSAVKNIGLNGGSVRGADFVGSLMGVSRGSISNSYTTGAVTGNYYVGGLAGYNSGSISSSYASAAVTGNYYVGGLVGDNSGGGGSISNSYATGAVTGAGVVGGLAGYNSSSISNSYATGAVVTSNYYTGGLVGDNRGSISNSYATGAVTGVGGVGGLVGDNYGSISNSYATGAVTGSNQTSGLANGGGNVTNSFWNTTTSGQASSARGTGLTSSQMQSASNFTGFNFTTTPGASGNNWVMVDVDGSLNNAGGSLGATRPMLASEFTTSIGNAHQLQLMAMDRTASYSLAKNIDASATATANDVWSSNTFIPVGNASSLFTGTLDGQGRNISNLMIYQPAMDYAGLFGITGGASAVKNIGLMGASVTGNSFVGGLMGQNNSGSISNSYVSGTVRGIGAYVGGMVGNNGGPLSNSYASGAVNGTHDIGGLAGFSQGPISNSYANAAVTGSGSNVSGLVGSNWGTVSNSLWDTEASGRAASAGGQGMSTADMKKLSNFTSATAANGNANPGWDFTNTWVMYDGYTTPLLRAFMTPLSVTAANATKTYDGAAYSGSNGVSYSSTPNSNLLGTLSYTGSSQGAVNAGAYAIAPSGLYSHQQGYIINYASGALTINPAVLSLSGTRVYDGSTSMQAGAFGTGGTLATGVAGETVRLTGAGTVDSKNVVSGTQALSTGTLALADGSSGDLASNYTLEGGTHTASITAKALSLNGTRVYDGSTSMQAGAFGTGGSVATGVAGETVQLTGTGTVNSKNVVSGTQALSTGTLALADGSNGDLASNYTLEGGTHTASITTKALSAVVSAPDKVYDGNAVAAPTLAITAGLVGSETLTTLASGTFNSKDVATANLVTVNAAALADGSNGGLASNYSLAAGQSTTAHITPKALTVTGMSAANKVYDASTTAALTGGTLSGLVGSETLGFSGQRGNFADKNAGTGKAVSVSGITLTNGTGLAGNYTVANPTGLSAAITPKALSAVASASDKVYDGSTAANATLSLQGLVGSETLTALTSATFNTKDVATANLVTVNIAALANGSNGGLASNYTLAAGQSAAARITPKALSAEATASDKTYTGTAVAAAALTITGGLVGSETVTARASATFNTKDVATANLVTVNRTALSNGDNGGLASNYYLAAGQSAAAHIKPRALTAEATANDKIYTGTAVAAAALTITGGLVGSETVTARASATFNTKDVATANLVTVNRTALSNGANGGLASNYYLAAGQSAAAHIKPRALTAEATANDKIYTGTAVAAAALTITGGLVGSETVTARASATFNTKDVATANLVTVNRTALSDGANGGLASNYYLAAGQTAMARITPRALMVSGMVAANKTYDGTRLASLSGGILQGLVGTETLSFTGHSGTFADALVGTRKAVTVTGIRLESGTGLASNYSVTNPTGLTASITPATTP